MVKICGEYEDNGESLLPKIERMIQLKMEGSSHEKRLEKLRSRWRGLCMKKGLKIIEADGGVFT